MTTDKTSDTVLRSLRGQVYQFLPSRSMLTICDRGGKRAFRASSAPPIEMISANKHWIELLVPCERSVVGRVQSFLSRLETDLPPEVIEKVGYAFRELLNNAIEWGGRLDPNLKVRISYIRTKKMLMYRLDDPGPGFKLEESKHAAVNNPEDDPIAHMKAREEKGLRPGGLGTDAYAATCR